MRFFCILVFTLFATAQNAFAQDWLIHYYEHPTPERFVAEVTALGKAGKLSDPKSAGMISVFMGKVMAANPTRVDGWLNELGHLKGKDRQTVLAAANLSNTSPARSYLERQPDAGQFRATGVDIRVLEPKYASVLDFLWADFFATGEVVPIRRIVAALNYDKHAAALDRYAQSEKTDKDREEAMLGAVFKAAIWSLESNAKQHRRVGDLLEQIYYEGKLTQPEQLWVSVILSKAYPEKFEMTHLASGQWQFKRKLTGEPAALWRDGEGKAVADSDSMKSKGDFGGSLLATTDDDWKQKWETPPETKPHFTKADTVAYGKKVHILTFLVNPQLDPKGNANVRCDFRITAPTRKVVHEQKDVVCLEGPMEGSPYLMRLAGTVIGFSGDPGDPAGTWTVNVLLKDTVRNVELALRTSFELKR
jgi:hypothetical protein